jgi:adenosylcobinamide-GDP ribazoletransferase
MKPFLAALRFLTILPVPSRAGGEEKSLSRSVAYFPVVGLLIGLAVALLDSALIQIFPQALSSVLVVVALIAVSGGLHIDGLADTADGFLSSRPREQMLEIMRDSRTGPMGVIAIVCVIALKATAVASISPGLRWGGILMMPLAGRCALPIMFALLPYARAEGGLASVFQQSRPALSAFWAAGALACVGWFVAGTTGLAMAGVSLVGILMFSAYTRSKIGGLTGDTLGAGCEIIELLPALVAAAASYGT